jgi:hypothetical protein
LCAERRKRQVAGTGTCPTANASSQAADGGEEREGVFVVRPIGFWLQIALVVQQTLATEEALDALADEFDDLLDVLSSRSVGGAEDRGDCGIVSGIDPIQHDAVKMYVYIKRTARELDEGHRSRLSLRLLGSLAQPLRDHLQEQGENALSEFDSAGQKEPEGHWHREDPLSNGHIRDHFLDKVDGRGGHPTSCARWTEAASLARERQEMVMSAFFALQPGESPLQHPAIQVFPQFLLDPSRNGSVRFCGLCEEGLQVLQEDLGEDVRPVRAGLVERGQSG